MNLILEDVIKLLLSLFLGGLIGLEREYRDKAAGFRTVIFISLGSTLFTITSINFSPAADPSRIAAQIITGIGFLGAGAILRDGGRIVGLTTAAVIWLAAAIGMSVGAGFYLLSIATTALVLVVLWLFPKFEDWIDHVREVRTYEIVCESTGGGHAEVERLFIESGLHISEIQRTKKGHDIVFLWRVQGSPKSHAGLVDKLLLAPEVKEFTF